MSLGEMDGTNGSKLICSLCLKLQLTKFIEQGVEDNTGLASNKWSREGTMHWFGQNGMEGH
ncbi:hypothetical protein DY000_02039214 [Brassica cretica]|uniref:Uncharacterized protein n=1 Tax=Brassica cretica TaxID=69181 RepID=A0ABQ7B966_BRACR|nr:hypothetical protein DY000_02039214 [Brassica cretica]